MGQWVFYGNQRCNSKAEEGKPAPNPESKPTPKEESKPEPKKESKPENAPKMSSAQKNAIYNLSAGVE